MTGERVDEARLAEIRALLDRPYCIGAEGFSCTCRLHNAVPDLLADHAALAAELAACREALVSLVHWSGPGSDVVEWQCSVCLAEWYGSTGDAPSVEHKPDCLLSRPAGDLGREILAAARGMADAIEVLGVAYLLDTARVGQDVEEVAMAQAALDRLRALLPGAGEGA